MTDHRSHPSLAVVSLVSRVTELASLTQVEQRQLYLRVSDIEPGGSRLLRPNTAARPAAGSIVFQKGDILFSRADVVRRRVWVANGTGCCSPEFFVLRPEADISATYLAHVLRAPLLAAQLAEHQLGTNRPSLQYGHLEAVRIPIPAWIEQERISKMMDEVEYSLKRIRFQQRFMAGLPQAAFRVVFEQFLNTSQSDVCLGDVADIRQGLSNWGRQVKRPSNLGHELLRLSAGDVFRYNIRLRDDAVAVWVSAQEVDDQVLTVGDVLLHVATQGHPIDQASPRLLSNVTAAVFGGADRTYVPEQGLIRIRLLHPGVQSAYLAGWLNSAWAVNQFGILNTNITASSLRAAVGDLRFPMPPDYLQHRFVKIVEDVLYARELSNQQRKASVQLYDALADKALCGELTGAPVTPTVDVLLPIERTIARPEEWSFPTAEQRPLLRWMDRNQKRIWQWAWECDNQPFTFRQFRGHVQRCAHGVLPTDDEMQRTLELLARMGCLVAEPFGDFVRWRRLGAQDYLEV